MYAQIIQDITDAQSVLPAVASEFGRVTKGFAQHLLSKVYLTRGYKPYGGNNADFQLAATTAEALINSGTYTLKAKYADLFDPAITNFQSNSEVIFSVQYSTNATSNGAGNSLHQYFYVGTPKIPRWLAAVFSMVKTNNAVSPDPFFFSLFDRTRDSRFLANVYEVVYAQNAGAIGSRNFCCRRYTTLLPGSPLYRCRKSGKKLSRN